MPCLRLAAALLLIVTLGLAGGGPAAAQNAEAPGEPTAPGQLPNASPRIPDFPATRQPGDVFGEAVTLPERTIIYLQGQSTWESAQDTLVDAFKSLDEYLGKHGIKPDGPPMTIYTETSDSGFKFRAAVPVAQAPPDPPKGDLAVGQAPAGKALKFVHRGSYEELDATYEAITDYLDDKGIDAKDQFIEEYVSGPLRAGDGELVVNILVPVKEP
jgi:effector-binding domain-containing protein